MMFYQWLVCIGLYLYRVPIRTSLVTNVLRFVDNSHKHFEEKWLSYSNSILFETLLGQISNAFLPSKHYKIVWNLFMGGFWYTRKVYIQHKMIHHERSKPTFHPHKCPSDGTLHGAPCQRYQPPWHEKDPFHWISM